MSFGKLCPFSIDANVLKLDQCDSNSESALANMGISVIPTSTSWWCKCNKKKRHENFIDALCFDLDILSG